MPRNIPSRLAAFVVLAAALAVPMAAKPQDAGSDYNPPPQSGPASSQKHIPNSQYLPPPDFFYAKPDDDDVSGPAKRPPKPGRAKSAQTGDGDTRAKAAREKLRKELARIRKRQGGSKPGEGTAAHPESGRAAEASPGEQTKRAPDPALDRLAGQLLLFRFEGTHPDDPGVKAARSLLEAGSAAGLVLGAGNVNSKAQLKELMRFLAAAAPGKRPILAAAETGGDTTAFTFDKGFEPWPSQQAVAAKNDPQYAYSIYGTLASNLAYYGFNLNFGPWLGAPDKTRKAEDSFGSDPAQVAVFAKTFILGHVETGMIAVPMLGAGEASLSALRDLYISYPETPVSIANAPGDLGMLAAAASGHGGARICFAAPESAEGGDGAVAADFRDGCDMVVLGPNGGPPNAVHARALDAIAAAIASGGLTLDRLKQAAVRAGNLRSALETPREKGVAQRVRLQ